MEVAAWVSYGPFLIFDLRRAIHHDWTFHFTFHIFLLASATYFLVQESFFQNPNEQLSNQNDLELKILLAEVIISIVFLALVMLKPKDFPYSKKIKKLTESFIPKYQSSNLLSPSSQSKKDQQINNFGSTTARPKEQITYNISSKIISFKIIDGKLLFQLVTKINQRPVKKINRSLEEFEKVGIELDFPIARLSITEQINQFNIVMQELDHQLQVKLLNERMTNEFLNFLGVPFFNQQKIIEFHNHQLSLMQLYRNELTQHKKVKNTLLFLFTQKRFEVSAIEVIDDQGYNIRILKDIIFIQYFETYKLINLDQIKDEYEEILNDLRLFKDNQYLFHDTNIYEKLTDIQECLINNKDLLYSCIKVFSIKQLGIFDEIAHLEITINVEFQDIKIEKAYSVRLDAVKQIQLIQVFKLHIDNMYAGDLSFEECVSIIQDNPLRYLNSFQIRNLLEIDHRDYMYENVSSFIMLQKQLKDKQETLHNKSRSSSSSNKFYLYEEQDDEEEEQDLRLGRKIQEDDESMFDLKRVQADQNNLSDINPKNNDYQINFRYF
ncbi:UNKNOWN [Stylonychia lemnae]|uniref:Transmembrane protein n=1 Tax=Stylonychia lemnae TaxID=5949 RepID=A0A078AH63_STYLE|nr:UNKNOWN [Stylonychia lemnae]|eukprot:CDW80183.1 UNKNOWN [Stylonychia lemnae]